MISFAILIFVAVMAFTSIGFGPFGGWWHHDYEHTGPVVNQGAMTLDVLPSFIDGDGLAWGNHPFGQDDTGIDYFALTMRGTQESLIIAFIVGIVATVLGVVVGALAGYFRGWTEGVLMRITDLMLTMPLLVIGGRRRGQVREPGDRVPGTGPRRARLGPAGPPRPRRVPLAAREGVRGGGTRHGRSAVRGSSAGTSCPNTVGDDHRQRDPRRSRPRSCSRRR